MPLAVSSVSLFAYFSCIAVAVSAFSPTQRSIILPSLNDGCCTSQIKIAQCSNSRSGCNRLKHCAQSSLSNTDDDISIDSCNNGNDDASSYYNNLLSHFRGDFDNYEQVVNDRRHGLTPGEGGGHEHIHCTLVPCPQYTTTAIDDVRDGMHQEQIQWVLAAFYFNANPRQIFRFRVYQLHPPASNGKQVRMKLHTLLPHLERQLRQCSDEPCIWWKEVWNVWCQDSKNVTEKMMGKDEWGTFQTIGVPTMVSPLLGCDVLWDPNWDRSKHSYLYVDEYGGSQSSKEASSPQLPTGQSCHATMEAGSKGAIVDSISLIPGKRILIKDELSLWRDEFWINDRGYDPDVIIQEIEGDEMSEQDSQGMPFVYGNRKGVPYKLQRVSDFENLKQTHLNADIESSISLKRVIVNSGLEWTLGDEYRTPEMHQKNMQAVNEAGEFD